MDNYILDENHNPVVENNLFRWENWFQTANRVVCRTQITKDVFVSTIFLGIDHNFSQENSQPILFETMIFGGERDGECIRYSTWNEAKTGHEKIVAEFNQRCSHCNCLRSKDEVECPKCGALF